MGFSICDHASHEALKTISAQNLLNLHQSVGEYASRGEVGWKIILDNTQATVVVFEPGIGHTNEVRWYAGYAARSTNKQRSLSKQS